MPGRPWEFDMSSQPVAKSVIAPVGVGSTVEERSGMPVVESVRDRDDARAGPASEHPVQREHDAAGERAPASSPG